MSFIQVRKLGHKFNIKDKDGNVTGEKWAVKDMDFDAHKGQIIAVLGRNGSGKSTFARHLNGLYAPNQGTVWIQGDSDVLDASREGDLLAIRRAVGMIFQNPDNQMVGNTVAEDVGFGLENLGFQAEKIWERINEVLRLTGMEAYLERNVSHLSGGQKQRLAIASVMAMSPECIVMDEATAMLDPVGSRQILDTLYHLNREFGITVIMITHRMEETVRADQIYVMDDGNVELIGAPYEIYPQVEKLEQLGLDSLLPYKLLHELKVDYSDDKKFVKELDENAKSALVDRKERLLSVQDAADRIKACLHDKKLFDEKNLNEQNVLDDIDSYVNDTKNINKPEVAEQINSAQKDIPSSKNDILVEADNLEYSYKDGAVLVPAVEQVSFQIRKGEILAVAGQTGSGKSTLLYMLNGIYRPMGGTLKVDGIDVGKTKNLKELRKKIGFVFQYPEYQLFESTVLADVMYGALNFGMSKAEAEQAAREALALVNISEEYYEYSPFDLSGGQKKRVALAGILAYKPEILILDEPVAGMDPKAKRELFALIRRLHEERNITVIFVSHDMKDVYEIADRILVMGQGKLVYDGAVEQAFGTPEMVEKLGLEMPEMAVFRETLLPEIKLTARSMADVIDELRDRIQGLENL
jgi:energy-coupling factor transporter ATPase